MKDIQFDPALCRRDEIKFMPIHPRPQDPRKRYRGESLMHFIWRRYQDPILMTVAFGIFLIAASTGLMAP